MTQAIAIPRLEDWRLPGPGWIPVRKSDQSYAKPRIKCECGKIVGIGLHHVHSDGRVTRSFFHSTAKSFVEGGRTYAHDPGCGWHVFLVLKDYDCGDFPPVP